MSTPAPYIIVRAGTLQELEFKVAGFILQNYEPLGAPFNPNAWTALNDVAQAMTLRRTAGRPMGAKNKAKA